MDLTNLGYAILALGVILFGVFFALSRARGVPKNAKWLVLILAVVLIMVPLIGAPGMQTAQAVNTPPTSTPPSISFTSMSGVTYVSSSNVLKVVATLNYTTPSIKVPASGVFKFDAIVNSLMTTDTFPSVVFASNPAISNTTKASSDDFLFSENTGNSTMVASVQLPNNVNHFDLPSSGASYLFPLKSASVAQLNFSFTLSPQGLDNLNTNQGVGAIVDYSLEIAGQFFTIEVVLTTVI